MHKRDSLLIIGLMSGTSVDGIDVALVKTDGESLQCLQRLSCNYRDTTRQSILHVYENPTAFLENSQATQALSVAIAEDHAAAVQQVLSQSQQQVQLLGFHGQTVLHQPDQGITVQLGDAHTLAELTRINTVHDFRRRDMAAGGQGAPLAPIYHECLIRQAALELPALMLNIGGVANLTYSDGNQLTGFDTGPGNGLLDQYMQQYLQQPFDINGQLAEAGSVNQTVVDEFLSDAYFNGIQPKSLDRSSFKAVLTSQSLLSLSHADAMATLLALTVASVKRAIDQLAARPKQLVVCGGGQHNRFLMHELERVLNTGVSTNMITKVNTADSLQLAGDHIEAELMGLLAARYHFGLASTYPSTTGASIPCIAGTLHTVDAEL